MIIKSFDTLADLSERFDGPVFQDISDDTLFVHDVGGNRWLRYRWTPGKREIAFLEDVGGELPIVTQVYPRS